MYVIDMKNTFTKEERLCSKVLIDKLFHGGSSFIVYPFRVVYLKLPHQATSNPAQVIISVSKKRFKRAHNRNRIKRLMREVYRLQKGELLYSKLNKQSLNLNLAIQYIGKEELDYSILYQKMNRALIQLVNEVSA